LLKELFAIGCIHERTLCKQQKYTDLKSGLETLYPNHKVHQVNILLEFLGGYNKQQLEELEKVGLNIKRKELDQTMSKMENFTKLQNSESFPHVYQTSLVPHMYIQLSRMCTAQNCQTPQYSL